MSGTVRSPITDRSTHLAANHVTGISVDYAIDGEQVTIKMGYVPRAHRLRHVAMPYPSEQIRRRDHM